jgi:uncharacterized lipoprotein NlpE involved in copper resistance
MKKITLLALTAFMMVGCDNNSNSNIDTKTGGTICETIIVDSCEYIKGYNSLAHKGNCKFCAERRKKELDSLALKIWEGFE